MIELQKASWNALCKQVDRLPHALLLQGPEGVGKLLLAEQFAQLLLCEANGARTEPCRRCDACRWVAAGNHPDLRLVEPEAIARSIVQELPEEAKTPRRKPSFEIRVEQVRALAEFLNFGSHRGRRRIAILHPAEDMNAVTANALLKSLEEPPASAMFLLVSHRPARLLPTIRSRCIAVPVPLPDPAAARLWLQEQGVRDAARWLAFAGGAPRRALEAAAGERSAALEAILRALSVDDTDGLLALNGREEMELLVDVLQKQAVDQALAAFRAAPKYGIGGGRTAAARQWLAYARALGRSRALARHPLNPRLFAADLLAGRPGKAS